MAYGAVVSGGVLEVPFDRLLGLMYGARHVWLHTPAHAGARAGQGWGVGGRHVPRCSRTCHAHNNTTKTPLANPPPPGMAIANLVKFLILIPFWHNWVLGRGAALTALAFYAVYSVAYTLTVSGVV